MYIEKLLGRTLLVHLKANPAPSTLGESLQLHTTLSEFVGSRGTVMHYRQSVCPVTKERLPSVRLMLEDFGRDSAVESPTALEKDLEAIGETYDYLRLTSMTRDKEAILRVGDTS